MRELTGTAEPKDRLRRVYVVCAEVPPDVVGGLGRYAERMTAALRDLGTPVEVFGTARYGPRRPARTERDGNVVVHRIPVPGHGRARESRWPAAVHALARIAGLLAFNVWAVARILRGGRAGAVVAVHDWMGCPAGLACRLLARMPVVFHVHTRELAAGAARSPLAAVITALETAQARVACLIVVPSTGMRDELIAHGWPARRLRVLPHGAEEPELLRLAVLPDEARERLRAEIRRRYLPGGAGRLIVFAGRLSPHKGVATLVRAVPRIAREHGDARIVLLGGPAPRTDDDVAVARLIAELGVGRQVAADYRFVAPAEVFAHFLAADVCVFPSVYEPFGLVAVEAMALARPVVVGPGYSPEVVGDGAVRCDRDSPEELAAAVLGCLADPQGARRLGRRGAAYVRERYSWARTAELTLAAYAQAVR